MHLNHLSLKNFRSYSELELPLNKGITIFIGRNGEGKTNIVESILSSTKISLNRIYINSSFSNISLVNQWFLNNHKKHVGRDKRTTVIPF